MDADYNLDEHIQHMVDNGLSGLDIMHGELKNLMYEAELSFEEAQRIEDESGEAMDSMERKYWEGVLDTLGDLYKLTYQLSFAIAERDRT